jgi:hypothetical protein
MSVCSTFDNQPQPIRNISHHKHGKGIDTDWRPAMSYTGLKSNRQWTQATAEGLTGLQMSNENACLPATGMKFWPAFCSDAGERQQILRDIAQREFVKEGFDRRIRVQKYSISDHDDRSNCPESLRRLARRLQACGGAASSLLPPATQIVVEEHPITPWSYSGDYAPNLIVSSFESRAEGNDPACFVACVTLQNGIIQHINKPAARQDILWKLESDEHHTNILLEPGSLLVQQEEFLDQWRVYSTAAPINAATVPNDDEEDGEVGGKSILVKFLRLPVPLEDTTEESPVDFGYTASPEDLQPRLGDMPPLHTLLTIIVTTSPIKSHPATELLERTFATFPLGGRDFVQCPKVIVCDGFRKQEGEFVSKKHNCAKQKMRNGIVNDEQAGNYAVFKDRLKVLCASAATTADSPFCHTTVKELPERMGYGFALRHALRHCVTTPFVCVIQHDRTFMRPTPMEDVVHAMWRHRQIKYTGISMRSNLVYRDIFCGKYGKASEEEMGSMIVRPPELLLDASQYGPAGDSIRAMKCTDAKVRKSINAISFAYQSSAQCTEQLAWTKAHPVPAGKHQLTLTPTLFWYDNTHVAETAHYRDFIFHPTYRMVARGGFVEDKLSPVLKRTVERLGLPEGHARFGCFLLDDHSGMYFTGHLDGGSYITTETRAALVSKS